MVIWLIEKTTIYDRINQDDSRTIVALFARVKSLTV